MHILLVEDNRDLAANVGEFLESRGHVVDYAADGLTGLHLAATNRYDALVLDLGLPGIDGLQTYIEIVRRHAGIIDCVMITGDSSAQLAQDAHDLGIHHVICKPFRFSDLQRLLETPAETTADAAVEATA